MRLLRGEKHNALDWAMLVAIKDAITELEGTPDQIAAVRAALSEQEPSFEGR